MMTERASIKYMPPIIGMNKTVLDKTATDDTIPP